MKTKPHYSYFILSLLLIILISVPLMISAYDPTYDIYCFGREDCDRLSCILTRVCTDDQPGCNVSCIRDGPACPMNSACPTWQGSITERCGYYPIQPSCNITATGSPVTLTWSSDANSNCEASGGWSGTKPTSGTEVVYPSTGTIYTLTCTNDCLDGSLSTSCSVAVGNRHENCCDNWGWNNVERCGGCCGPAENCVGYDNSAPYYWHNSNDLWQCSYSDSSDSMEGCFTRLNPVIL